MAHVAKDLPQALQESASNINNMNHLPIHPEGPVFSRIIAGAWRWHTVSREALDRLIRTCLDNGITTFDHADIYGDHGNERIFGEALAKDNSLRDKMQIVTKCGIQLSSSHKPENRIKHYNTSKEYIISTAERSIQLLNVEKIDLLLIHRPDPLMDPAEVAEAFGELKKSGKVLNFGVSNFTGDHFDMLQSYLSFPLVTNQIEISLFLPEPLFDGTIDNLMKHKARPMAWSPLGGGKFLAGENEKGNRVLDNLNHFCARYHMNATQLLLAWLMRHPSMIFPVVGTTKPERIAESAKTSDTVLDRQDWFEMLKWVTGKDVA
jgi:predicted oxidoreductase